MKARYRIDKAYDDEFVVDTETGAALSLEDLVEKLNEQEVSLVLLSALEETYTEQLKGIK